MIFLGISVLMSFFPSSGFHFQEAFSHGDRKASQISITFDDGPNEICTPGILDILAKYQVKAAFFVIGKNIDGNEHLLGRIVSEGHIIGNHSWAHSNFWDFLPSGKMAEDIERCNIRVETLTGRRMKFFRPPYGVINPMVAKAIQRTGMKAVVWSYRSFDTNARSGERLLERTLGRIRNGDVLLFHDTSRLTLGILEKIIVSLQERGFEFVSPDRLLNMQAYETV